MQNSRYGVTIFLLGLFVLFVVGGRGALGPHLAPVLVHRRRIFHCACLDIQIKRLPFVFKSPFYFLGHGLSSSISSKKRTYTEQNTDQSLPIYPPAPIKRSNNNFNMIFYAEIWIFPTKFSVLTP